MKINVLILLWLIPFLYSCASKETQVKRNSALLCEYGKANACNNGDVCMNVNTGVSECRPIYNSKQIDLLFPFLPAQEAICDQGVLTPAGNSHTWWNTAYAIDLKSLNTKEDTKVLAGASGRVIAFNNCETQNDKCGGGFGNSVKILTEDGFLVHYSHLKRALVKSDEFVKSGALIGIEGATGWTGTNNRHLHLSVHFDWRQNTFEYWKQEGFLPPSVPFSLKMCKDKCSSDCEVVSVDVKDIKCRRTSDNVRPLCNK